MICVNGIIVCLRMRGLVLEGDGRRPLRGRSLVLGEMCWDCDVHIMCSSVKCL